MTHPVELMTICIATNNEPEQDANLLNTRFFCADQRYPLLPIAPHWDDPDQCATWEKEARRFVELPAPPVVAKHYSAGQLFERTVMQGIRPMLRFAQEQPGEYERVRDEIEKRRITDGDYSFQYKQYDQLVAEPSQTIASFVRNAMLAALIGAPSGLNHLQKLVELDLKASIDRLFPCRCFSSLHAARSAAQRFTLNLIAAEREHFPALSKTEREKIVGLLYSLSSPEPSGLGNSPRDPCPSIEEALAWELIQMLGG